MKNLQYFFMAQKIIICNKSIKSYNKKNVVYWISDLKKNPEKYRTETFWLSLDNDIRQRDK